MSSLVWAQQACRTSCISRTGRALQQVGAVSGQGGENVAAQGAYGAAHLSSETMT